MSKKQAIKAISLLWLGSILGAGCAFLTQVILARKLGPTDFGIFSSALATITLLTPLAGFGISQYWLKAFGQEGWQAMRWLTGSFKFTSLSTLVVIISLVCWAMLGPHDALTKTVLLVLTLNVLGQLATELVSGKLQLEERYLSLAFWQIVPHLMRLLLVVVLVYAATSIVSIQHVAYAYAAVALVLFISGAWLLLGMYQGSFSLKGHNAVEIHAESCKSIVPGMFQVAAQSWPFGLAGLFYLIYFQSDIILVKYIVGAEAAGLYNVAFTVMVAVYLLPGVIYQKFLLPKIHRWANHDRVKFYQVYRQGNLVMLVLGLAAMVALWILVPWGIPFLFGIEYQNSIFLLMILATAAPVRFLASSAGAVLGTKQHIINKIYIMGFAAALNIVLNLLLIPMLGMNGAAISTVATETLLLIALQLYARYRIFNDFNGNIFN